MSYLLDDRLASSSHKIMDWSLSEVRLKDNANFPWIILIPRVSPSVSEVFELSENQQRLLSAEIIRASHAMKIFFQAEKINIGILGNIVLQLHIHVIARFKQDLCWPHSLWQENIPEKPYDVHDHEKLIKNLREQLA